MMVTRTAEPIRGLSVFRDTKHALEALKLGQKGRRTDEIDGYEVDTCVYSIAQDIEDVRMKDRRQFIHNLFLCQTEFRRG